MTEVEVKILEINRDKTIQKFLDLGAQKTFEGDLLAWHFDFPDKRIEKAQNLLRLRKEGDTVTFTFKKKVESEQAKIFEESEVKVSDFETMKTILLAIGLEPNKVTSKKRVVYSLPGAHFAIDEFTGEHVRIPAFLEIETEDVDTLYRYVEQLGFKREDCKKWTQWDVINFYESK